MIGALVAEAWDCLARGEIKEHNFIFQKADSGLILSSIKPKRKGDEYGSIDQV
jgi:hypothetical protein